MTGTPILCVSLGATTPVDPPTLAQLYFDCKWQNKNLHPRFSPKNPRFPQKTTQIRDIYPVLPLILAKNPLP